MNPQLNSVFRECLKAVLSIKKDTLVKRPEWGEVNFEPAKADLDKIFELVHYLSVLPIDVLPENVISSTKNVLDQIINIFNAINTFSISTNNAVANRDNYANQIKSLADGLFLNIAQWIPFLAYQKGDYNAPGKLDR